MSHVHLTAEQLQAYAEGRLAENEERSIEAAASACAECGQALRAEARLELALPAVARQLASQERRRRVRFALPGPALAAAAAAAVFLWIGHGAAPPPGVDVAAAPLALIAAETDAQVRDVLIQKALRAGLAVPDGQQLLVPRYEATSEETHGATP
jgi:hypothetical protein